MDRFRATLDGGFALGANGNLVDVCARARQHLQQGKRVWLRQVGDPKQRVIEIPPGENVDLITYNIFGEIITDQPDWLHKASRLLSRST